MSEFKSPQPNLPTSDQSIESGYLRRPVKGISAQIKDMMSTPDTILMTMLGISAVMIIFPPIFPVAIFVAFGYWFWASSQKYKLPFKAPIQWGGKDYGARAPGAKVDFNKAGGILFYGNCDQTGEEMWIENGDARRHGFFLGTTGSGKALPMDALILTPEGWMRNADIVPGQIVSHPDGGTAKVTSVHRQGKIPAIRVRFADGRSTICSRDHLWQVSCRSGGKASSYLPELEHGKIMEAADLGIIHGLYFDKADFSVPRPAPFAGIALNAVGARDQDGLRAGINGIASLGYLPELVGTPEWRINFIADFVRTRCCTVLVTDTGLRLVGLQQDEAVQIKRIVWSLGGEASTWLMRGGMTDVQMFFDGMEAIHEGAVHCNWPYKHGLLITGVEMLDEAEEMSCIKVDREDGLYIAENHIVTHNTELLLGVVSQALMWSSGFLFVDGKGTVEFYARVWTLCKRFGREDDLRLLNFTDPGSDPDAPAGGPMTQSNTMNPFSKGTPDQLQNILVSLMGGAGSGNDMWKSRAESLVTSLMLALTELRDRGDILMNVQTIRDFLFLGRGFDKAKLRGKTITKISDVPDEAWDEIKERAGLIELYLLALKGKLSNSAKLSLQGFFNTLPGFSLEKAMNGEPQSDKANEQYNFLSMQLTKPLGSLADGYGHIFRTPLGEVDMDDVVLNRRILIVLLPALQKSADEMQNCGKIIITLVKMMMGNASGSTAQGSRLEIVDAKQTRAPSPFIAVFDEVGSYLTKGLDTSLAQARALGFSIILAGQDLAAMQAVDDKIAETAAANASMLAVGKTVDGNKTVKFVQEMMGKTMVSVSSGYTGKAGMFGTVYHDRMDVTFQEVDRVRTSELQALAEGQFYFLFNGVLVRSSTFYIGEKFAENFSVNKFLKVRGPMDRVPGLDQSVELAYVDGYLSAAKKLANPSPFKSAAIDEGDLLSDIVGIHDIALKGAKKKDARADHIAWLAGILGVTGLVAGEADLTDDDDDDVEFDEDEDDEIGAPPVPLQRGRPQVAPESNWMTRGAAVNPGQGRQAVQRAPGSPSNMPINMQQRADAISRRQAAEASAPVSSHHIEADEGSYGHSVIGAISADTVHERQPQLIKLIEHEQEAVKEASQNGNDIAAMQIAASRGRQRAQETLGEMFVSVARNMSRVEQMLLSELADGASGADILKRSANTPPLPLQGALGATYVTMTMNGLEERFASES